MPDFSLVKWIVVLFPNFNPLLIVRPFTTTEPYTDEYENEIKPLSGTSGFAGAEVENKPLTEAEANRFKDLVGKIKKVWEYDTSLFDIVSEETAPYFAGDKNKKGVLSVKKIYFGREAGV